MKKRGKIAIASADAIGVHDDAHELVPRQANVTSFYPSISNDSKLVVFNQSTCGTDPDLNRSRPTRTTATRRCDGYDDNSHDAVDRRTRRAATRSGSTTPTAPANSGNSWPRFSPDKGNFRGELIYWIAFSSRRPYGSQVNYNVTPLATKPQLWIAAVRTGENIVGDPELGARLAAHAESEADRAAGQPRSPVGQGRRHHRGLTLSRTARVALLAAGVLAAGCTRQQGRALRRRRRGDELGRGRHDRRGRRERKQRRGR